jgi:mRNA interferase MazF
MRLKPGTVILVNFPFTNLQSSKVRPALVLTKKGDDVIILGIFSRVSGEIYNYWIIIDEFNPGFNQTGLKKTSIIKTEKITVVHQSLIKKEIGFISSDLMLQVKQTLRKTLEIEYISP